MDTIIRTQFAKYDADTINHIRSGIANMAEELGGTVSVATGCSGSDLVFHVLAKLQAFWHETIGIDVSFSHLFACEKQEWKRQWILHHWQPQFLFPDICAFGENYEGEDPVVLRSLPECKDLLSEATVPVPRADVWVCGFECDSVSSLNHRASENHGCIATGSRKTGRTAAGCVAYIARCRPYIFILENVKNLSATVRVGGGEHPAQVEQSRETDLQVLRRQFADLGYLTWCSVLNARDFGIPQNRARYYILGYSVSQAPVQLQDQSLGPRWLKMGGRVVFDAKMLPLPVGRFLLDEEDEHVQRACADESTKGGRGGAEKPAKELTYSTDHLSNFQMHSLAWPPSFDKAFAQAVSGHPDRVKELVFLFGADPRPPPTTRLGLVRRCELIHWLVPGTTKNCALHCFLHTAVVLESETGSVWGGGLGAPGLPAHSPEGHNDLAVEAVSGPCWQCV